jgi:hypothetical protein
MFSNSAATFGRGRARPPHRLGKRSVQEESSMARFWANVVDNRSIRWAIALGVIGTLLLMVKGFGFFSLILVGLVLADACLNSELTRDDPLVRRRAERWYGLARLAGRQQAGQAAGRRADTRYLRAGRWCGLGVVVLGVAGFVWWP